jgi:hypothetical protein
MTDQSSSNRRTSGRRSLLMTVVLPGAFVIAAVTMVGATIFAGGDDKVEATLSAGTVMIAALDHTVSTKNSEVGTEVRLETVEATPLEGDAMLPAGSVIRGEVTHSKGGGRVAGAPELTLRFTELEVDGETYRIEAQPFRVKGKSDALESAAQIGGGAVAGGVVGGVIGGGSGALKGAVLGGAIGTGVAIATDGDDLTLPAGQQLRIRLAEPVRIEVERRAGEDIARKN